MQRELPASEIVTQNMADLAASSAVILDRSPHPHRVKLKCPLCFRDATLDRDCASDARIRCIVCAGVAEFRQFRETWCESQREILLRACPEIRFPRDHQ